jgi:hypothetical protein
MSVRYNEVNVGGFTTVSGGNMPTDNYTNLTGHQSRTQGQGGAGGNASIVVIANSHPVEVDGDGGLWDTTSGVAVQDWQTNILCIGT